MKGIRNLLYDSDFDYNDPVTRFAYVYRYTTAHANIVYQIIRDSQVADLRDAFDAEEVNVSCIGGGPGSELLGLLKYMIRENKSTFLNCSLYDREKMWSDSWRNVLAKLRRLFRDSDIAFQMSTNFLPLDVTDPEASTTYPRLPEDDLFIMCYFMSEIFAERDEAEAFFEHLFKNAKHGSLFLFVDNGSWNYYNWFDTLANDNGLEFLEGSNHYPFQTESDEDKEDLGRYYDKFGYPRLQAQVAYRICRKL